MQIIRTELPSGNRNDWKTLRSLLPYLKQFPGRIFFAMILLVLAKLANVSVPIALKSIVDSLGATDGVTAILTIPVALLIAYGLLRFGTILFQELRNAIFAKASQQTTRQIALVVFEHLHQSVAALSPRSANRRNFQGYREGQPQRCTTAQLPGVQYRSYGVRNRGGVRHTVL